MIKLPEFKSKPIKGINQEEWGKQTIGYLNKQDAKYAKNDYLWFRIQDNPELINELAKDFTNSWDMTQYKGENQDDIRALGRYIEHKKVPRPEWFDNIIKGNQESLEECVKIALQYKHINEVPQRIKNRMWHLSDKETVRKLDKLHMYDCLKANKSLAAWGIEGRVPFLDKEFMDVAMQIKPKDKMINGERMEKWVLRKAFEKYLPESVAWRQKEQFSDGVGYDWIDSLKEVVNAEISDEQLANANYKFPIQTPTSKEEYYYRSIFAEHFPSAAAALCVPQEPSITCSSKIALEWDESFKNQNEPSGRAIKMVHEDAY